MLRRMLRNLGWYHAKDEIGCSIIHAAPTASKTRTNSVTLRCGAKPANRFQEKVGISKHLKFCLLQSFIGLWSQQCHSMPYMHCYPAFMINTIHRYIHIYYPKPECNLEIGGHDMCPPIFPQNFPKFWGKIWGFF